MSAERDVTGRAGRERRTVDNREFDAFARRIVRAYARRVAAGDVEALPALRDLASTVDTALSDAVTGLRGFGYSWAEIAARLGVSRQAAQMRWGHRTEERPDTDTRLGGGPARDGGDGLGVAVPGRGEAMSLDGSGRAAAAVPTAGVGGAAAAERTVSARLVASVQPLVDLSEEGSGRDPC